MNFFTVYPLSNPISYLRDSFLPILNSQQMKIAKIALATFCLIALTYYFASHYFTKTKITHDNLKEPSYEETETVLAEEPEKIPSPLQENHIFNEEIETVNPVQESQIFDEEIFNEEIVNPLQEQEIQVIETLPEIKEEEIATVDAIVTLPEEPSTTPYQAHIALRTRGGGLVGHDLEELPYGFNLYYWKYKDGSDFPIQADTLLLDFLIFNPSKEFQELSQGAFSFDLPSFLFTDKKEGDKLQLKYKGKEVELTLHQSEIAAGRSLANPGDYRFEDVFNCTVKHVLKEIDTGKLGFSGALFGYFDRFEGYTTDFEGVLFHAMHKDSSGPSRKPYIIQADVKDFREIEAIDSKNAIFIVNDLEVDKIRVLESDEMIIIQSEMCGVDNQVDIVLNEKFLCFYARDTSTFSPKIVSQYLRIVRWKLLFENTTLEEMQNHIKNAQTQLSNGIFTIKIPK
jgi:hypothetical protein